MKLFLLLLVVSMLFSCAFKKSEDGQLESVERFNRNIVINPKDDLDFDGIKNEDEKLLGLDPIIADIPEVRVRQIKEINTGVRIRTQSNGHSTSKFIGLSEDYINPIDSESRESLIRRKILNLQYLKVTDPTRLPDSDEMAQLADYDLFIVGRWRDRDFYPFKHDVSDEDLEYVSDSGRITSVFKVELKNLRGLNSIERVFLSTNLIDQNDKKITEFRTHPLLKSNNTEERFQFVDIDELKPIDNYFIYDINLETDSISDLLLDRNNVALKIKNFTFTRLGREYDFSQFVSQIEEKTARVIFSIGNVTKTYQVTPGITIEALLVHLGHKIESDINGNIISIDGVSNNLSTPIDLENISSHELNNGLWHILGEGEKSNELLVANKQYIVSYSTAKEMIESQALSTVLLENFELDKDIVEVPDARVGDFMEIQLSADRLIPYAEHYVARTPCTCEVQRIRSCGPRGEPDTCFYWQWEKNLQCNTTLKRVNYRRNSTDLKLNEIPLEFWFNGRTYRSSDLVSKYDGVGLYNNSFNAGFRFQITEEHLGEEKSFSIYSLDFKETTSIQIGYHSTENEIYRRNCTSHDTSTSTVKLKHKSILNINMNRKGINR